MSDLSVSIDCASVPSVVVFGLTAGDGLKLRKEAQLCIWDMRLFDMNDVNEPDEIMRSSVKASIVIPLSKAEDLIAEIRSTVADYESELKEAHDAKG